MLLSCREKPWNSRNTHSFIWRLQRATVVVGFVKNKRFWLGIWLVGLVVYWDILQFSFNVVLVKWNLVKKVQVNVTKEALY